VTDASHCSSRSRNNNCSSSPGRALWHANCP